MKLLGPWTGKTQEPEAITPLARLEDPLEPDDDELEPAAALDSLDPRDAAALLGPALFGSLAGGFLPPALLFFQSAYPLAKGIVFVLGSIQLRQSPVVGLLQGVEGLGLFTLSGGELGFELVQLLQVARDLLEELAIALGHVGEAPVAAENLAEAEVFGK